MSRTATSTRQSSPPRGLVRAFARVFLIQGSWNYRTMLGSGFAFALLPVLRWIHAGDRHALGAAVDRHLEHFNAHPYLAALALGAVARLEVDGADPETVSRFKVAIRGPLGSLGDALVWATVLPGAALAALALFWLGAPTWASVVLFLVVFNVVHLGLRVWGFSRGWKSGRDVGKLLARADLSGWTRRLEPAVVVLLGAAVGALLGEPVADAGGVWVVLASAAFVAGLLGGHRAWRPAAVGTVMAIGLLSVTGVLS